MAFETKRSAVERELSRTELRILSVLDEITPMSKFEIIAAMRMKKWADAFLGISRALKKLEHGGFLESRWLPGTAQNCWKVQPTFLLSPASSRIALTDIAPTLLEKLNHFFASIPPRDTDWSEFK